MTGSSPFLSITSAICAFIKPEETLRQFGCKLQLDDVHTSSPQHHVFADQRDLLVSRILQHPESLVLTFSQTPETGPGDVEVLGVEDDGVRVLEDVQSDLHSPGEVEAGEVGVDEERVMERRDGLWEPHLVPGEHLSAGRFWEGGLAFFSGLRHRRPRRRHEEQTQEENRDGHVLQELLRTRKWK